MMCQCQWGSPGGGAKNKMRVRCAVKKICKHCSMVRRGKKVYVVCSADSRHKQRQGFSTQCCTAPGCSHAAAFPGGVGGLPLLQLAPLTELELR